MDQESSRYHLVTLGEWRLERDARKIPIRGRKTKALITFLAFSQVKTHQRRRLANLLWPSHSDTQALSSLRQTLAEIRRCTDAFPPLINAGHSELQFVSNIIQLDVETMLAEIHDGSMGDETLKSFLLLPDILVDFHAISDDFDDWTTQTRASLQSRCIDGLRNVYEGKDIEPNIRLRVAQAVFALDGFDESAARAVIKSFAALNELPKALAFYDDLYAAFERELDAEPSLRTQDLVAQIKLNFDAPERISETDSATLLQTISGTARKTENAIAVLPFESLGPHDLPSYVQIGLLDEVTCALAGAVAPSPLSSNSMRRFLDQPNLSAAQVGQMTGARYVVSGSIRSDGVDARVAVQMADTSSEHVIWAEIYHRPLADVVKLEMPIAEKIVTSFTPSLHGAELRRTSSFSSEDLEPFQLVLRARDLIFNLCSDTFQEAGMLLETATRKGQSYAPGFAALADWHSVRIWQGWSEDPEVDQRLLEQYALKAINLNPADGRTMAFLGHNRLIFSYKYKEAQSYFDSALRNMPSDAETLNWTVPGLTYAGYPSEAIKNGERALALSPFDPFRFRNQHFLSIAHYAQRDFERAAELGLRSFEDNPTYVSNLRFTIASLHASGQRSRAKELVAYHHEIQPNFSVSKMISRHPFQSEHKRIQYGQDLVDAGLHS